MKTCPFCAEEIQDAAIVCKHCGRSLDNSQSRTPAVPKAARPTNAGHAKRFTAIGLLAIAVVAVALLVKQQVSTTTDGGVAQAGKPTPPPPAVNTIVDSNGVEVKAGQFVRFSFTSTDPRPCVVNGHVLGLAGGNKDVEVLLLDSDGFTNWRNHNTASTVFNGGQATATTITRRLPHPGTYYLVVSNAFSVLTDKTVQITATLTCG